MNSERECFVYIVLPGATEFVTAGRFRWTADEVGGIGQFVYGRSYRERADAVEFDPVELRLSIYVYETARNRAHRWLCGTCRVRLPAAGADDRTGALGFGSHVEPPVQHGRFNRTLDLARLQRVVDAIVTDDPDLVGSAGQAEELLLLGTSMGGVRRHQTHLYSAPHTVPDV